MTSMLFVAALLLFFASFRVGWLKKIRHSIEDQRRAAKYPLHLLPHDCVDIGGRYRVAQQSMTLNSEKELVAFIEADPKTGHPSRHERGWVHDV